MNKQIYLSGPIAGLNYEECTRWRNFAAEMLSENHIDSRDPMRGRIYKDAFSRVSGSSPLGDVVHVIDPCLNTDHGITMRDYQDTVTSDALFVNLLDTTIVSIGTVIEIAWAYERRIPTIVIMEKEGNLHDHPMLRDMIDYRVDSIAAAVNVAVSLFGKPI